MIITHFTRHCITNVNSFAGNRSKYVLELDEWVPNSLSLFQSPPVYLSGDFTGERRANVDYDWNVTITSTKNKRGSVKSGYWISRSELLITIFKVKVSRYIVLHNRLKFNLLLHIIINIFLLCIKICRQRFQFCKKSKILVKKLNCPWNTILWLCQTGSHNEALSLKQGQHLRGAVPLPNPSFHQPPSALPPFLSLPTYLFSNLLMFQNLYILSFLFVSPMPSTQQLVATFMLRYILYWEGVQSAFSI